MRIGVVTTSYPRWPGDAAGSFVAGHVAYLRGTGAEVEVIAAGDAQIDARWDRAEQVTRVAAPPGLFYAGGAPEALAAGGGRGAVGFTARLSLTVAGRARRWDAVAAHWLAPSAWAALPTRGPLLAIAHGGDVHLLARRRLLGPTLRALALRRGRLACVSPAILDTVAAAWPAARAHAIVSPMGVDDAATAAIVAARAARPTRTTITVVVLARLVPIKGVDVALAALARLPAHVRLRIAGDGPARSALIERAAALGITARVRFDGWLDAAARDRALVDADVVAVPSIATADGRHEGTPLAALEALAAGVPLVVTATGGLSSLALLGAHVVPPGDVDALAAAIEPAARAPIDPVPTLGWSAVGPRLDGHWGR
ncbi:MAG: glycosyltransferase [Myxococcales bacterium]|nr:glycosyltransferase [Myxococcales bacterium]